MPRLENFNILTKSHRGFPSKMGRRKGWGAQWHTLWGKSRTQYLSFTQVLTDSLFLLHRDFVHKYLCNEIPALRLRKMPLDPLSSGSVAFLGQGATVQAERSDVG